MILRALILAGLSMLFVSPAMTQQKKKPPNEQKAVERKAGGPKAIGKFDDWTAATHHEGTRLVCYAFTRVQSSTPALPGRGQVILTVTQRDNLRDTVALEAGFAYGANVSVTVQADKAGLDFYTSQRAAFARNGKAAVAALQSSGRAIARSPGPRDAKVVDTFSLKGFKAAYAAISKACPAK